jgi:hypothetical protein
MMSDDRNQTSGFCALTRKHRRCACREPRDRGPLSSGRVSRDASEGSAARLDDHIRIQHPRTGRRGSIGIEMFPVHGSNPTRAQGPALTGKNRRRSEARQRKASSCRPKSRERADHELKERDPCADLGVQKSGFGVKIR